MLEIGKRYIRTSPKGDESLISIKDQHEKEYHQDLANEGFTFKEVEETKQPNVCTSCEG